MLTFCCLTWPAAWLPFHRMCKSQMADRMSGWDGEHITDVSCASYSCRVSFFAVFDGHGGARASQFAAENLHLNLAKKFPISKF